MYGIRQGLSEARNLTGQSLQDDDAIEEYNHANHLEYLKQVSDATDKLKKKDTSDEDTTLEIDAGKAAISMHGVYAARNSALDMQEKVGKYLDKLKETGQDAEDLKKAFAEGGGVSGLVQKAFVSGVDKLKKKAKDSIDEVSDTARETYNSISQESQDAAADFSNLGQDTAESVRPNPRTPTAVPNDSVTPQSPPSESTIDEPVDEQPSVSSSLLDEEDVDDDEPTTQTGDVPKPDEVPLGDVPNRIQQTGKRPPPRRSRMTPQPDEMEGIRVQSPQRRPDEQAPELEEPDDRFEGGDLFDDDPSELRLGGLPPSRPTGVVRDIGFGDDDDDEEQERMEQEFEKTRNESVEAQTNKFTEGLKAPIKQTKSTIYPKEAFLTRDDSQVADFMDSDESINSMMDSVEQHTQLYGDDFNFRRKFNSNTRFVEDEFWPKDQAAPDLLPDDKVFHGGSMENGTINMTEGSQSGNEAILGDSQLVDEEPIAQKPLSIADGTTRTAVPVSERPPVLESQMPDIDEPPIESRAPPSNRLQIGDKRPEDPQVDLPDPEPEPDLPDPEPEPDLPDTRSARQRFIEQGDTEAPEPVFTDTPPPSEPTPQQPPPSEPPPSEPLPSEPLPSEPPPSEPLPSEPKPKLSSEDLRQGMEDAFKNPSEEGASRIGQVFGKTAGRVGKVVAKFGDIVGTGLNAAMAIDQTYNEAKDIFSKHPHLEGDDGWQKAGNLVGMIGEDVTLAGSITRFAGPEGAVIGTGLELAGGAVGLIGSGLSDIGDFFEGEKKKKTATQQAQKSVPKPPVIQEEAIQSMPGGLINQAQSSLKELN